MARNSFKNILRMIDNAKEELPVQEDFLEDLKRSIEREDEAGRRKPSQYYKPSSMNCIRNMYYQRVGKDLDSGYSSYTGVGICNAGTDIHVRTQTAVMHMKKFGYDCHYINVAKYIKNHKVPDIQVVSKQGMETKLLNTKYNISFLCDGIIKYKGKYYILELKSEANFKWRDREGVAPEHYHQATCYSLSLGITDVIFIYINRDNLDMKAFMFTPSGDMKQNIIGMINNCDEYVSRLITPPIPENVPKKACEYCNYKRACRKEGNGSKSGKKVRKRH